MESLLLVLAEESSVGLSRGRIEPWQAPKATTFSDASNGTGHWTVMHDPWPCPA